MKKRFFSILIISLIAAISTSLASEALWDREKYGAVKGMKRLPANGIVFVETEVGVFLMSENARYIVRGGELLDVWQNTRIRSLEELEQADIIPMNHFRKAGMRVEDLSSISIGSGQKEVTIFVTAKSIPSRELLKEASELSSHYRFTIVMLATDDQERKMALSVVCSPDPDKSFQRLISGVDLIQPPTTDCETSKFDKALVFAQLTGITKVPTVIAPDGTVMRGKRQALRVFLETK